MEKSRVVVQSKNERNYHIFYQLLSGANNDMKKDLFLDKLENYSYLNSTGCFQIDGVDDREEFAEVSNILLVTST